ncbi:MAG: hypothetical protein IIC50_09585 [Planctomycetes bacterium]|nr:hypothetical protein [Planctomycetota bacterium]
MIKHWFLPLVTTLLLSSILVARDYNMGQARGYSPSYISSYGYAVGQRVTVHGLGYVQAISHGGFATASSHAHNRGLRHHRPRPIPTPHKMIGHAHGGTYLGLRLHHRPRPIPTPHKMIGHLHGRTHLGLQLHHRPRPIPTPHKMIGHAHGGTHLGLQLHSHLRSSMGLRMISHLSVGRHGHHSQPHYH